MTDALHFRKLAWMGVIGLLLGMDVYAQNDVAFAGHKNSERGFLSKNRTADDSDEQQEKQTLLTALKELNRVKGVYFLFSEEKLSDVMVNEIRDIEKNTPKILDDLLKNTGLKYRQVSQSTFVILQAKEKYKGNLQGMPEFVPISNVSIAGAYAQNPIKGRITSRDGSPLSGVSITVKGTNRGTTADANGAFELDANKGETLVVSYVGYQTKEFMVGDDLQLNFTLSPSDMQMSEVVVTALGIRKESRRVGYAVSQVSGEGLTKARETNVANSLAGKVAGVSVSGVSGGPGASSNVVIRGVNNFRGAAPLYVINGVPMDNTTRGSAGMWGGADYGDGISNINPDDIEDISILKGSTASALYGSRASGGVILITTKSGKNKKGIGVEFNSNITTDNVIDYTDFQYEYGQGLLGVKPVNLEAAKTSGSSSWGAKIDGSNVIQFDGVQRPYTAHKDNIKNFYRTGNTFTNTIAFSGGNENGNFRLSVSDLHNESVVPNSGLDRNTINLNLNSKLSKRLTLAAIVNYVIEKGKNRPMLSDSPGNSNFGILFLPTTLDQEILKPGYLESDPLQSEKLFGPNIYQTNPWFAANRFINNTSRNRIITMGSIRYDFAKWLYVQGRIGQDYYNDRATSVTPNGTAYLAGGNINELFIKHSEVNADFLVGGEGHLNQDLGISATVGGNLMKSKREGLTNFGEKFNVPFLYVIENTNSRNTPDYSLPRKEVQSLYYTAEFSYRNLLFLNTTGRQDWFSTLPIDNNTLFYPSVSGSFVFSELWKPNFINYGKLRMSWANTSGDTDPFQTQLYYRVDGSINGVPIGVINNTSVPNSKLEPYRLKEFEAGFEARLLKNRLSIDLAWFNRKTVKEIVNVPASITSGYTGATINLGELENKGVEVLLNGTLISKKTFSWNSSFNFTKLNNKVLKLAEEQKSYSIAESRTQNAYVQHIVGKPASQVMAFDYKRDANGNKVFDADGRPMRGELIPMGSGFHDKYGGWNNELNYKNFNLGFLIDFKYGGKIFSATNSYAASFGLHQMTLEGREAGVVGDGVSQSGNKNTVSAKAWDYYGALASNVSSEFVYDASFIKLRQVVLGYNIPASVFRKTPIQGMSVSLVGRNLAILHKETPNIDPESNYNNSIGQGLELAGVPPYRSFGLNLNVKF